MKRHFKLTRAAGATALFSIHELHSDSGNITVNWGDCQSNTYENNNDNITHTYSSTASAKTITITSDVSLNRLVAYSGHLTSFSGGDNNALTDLYLSNNQLTTFNPTGLNALTYLDLDNNQLTTFDPTGLNALTDLYLSDNQLTTFNPTGLNALTYLDLDNNQLTTFDTTGLNALTHLYLSNNRLSVSSINSILQHMDGLTTAPNTVYLNGQTPPAIPTGAGLAAKNSLIAKGVDVRTDGGFSIK